MESNHSEYPIDKWDVSKFQLIPKTRSIQEIAKMSIPDMEQNYEQELTVIFDRSEPMKDMMRRYPDQKEIWVDYVQENEMIFPAKDLIMLPIKWEKE